LEALPEAQQLRGAREAQQEKPAPPAQQPAAPVRVQAIVPTVRVVPRLVEAPVVPRIAAMAAPAEVQPPVGRPAQQAPVGRPAQQPPVRAPATQQPAEFRPVEIVPRGAPAPVVAPAQQVLENGQPRREVFPRGFAAPPELGAVRKAQQQVGRPPAPTPAIVPQESSLVICNNRLGQEVCNRPINVTCKGKQGGTYGCFYDAKNTKTLLSQLVYSNKRIEVYQGDDETKDVSTIFFENTKRMAESNQLSMKIIRGGARSDKAYNAYADEVRGEKFARRAFLYNFPDHMAYATVEGLRGENKSCFRLQIPTDLSVKLDNNPVHLLYVILQIPCQTTLSDMLTSGEFKAQHFPKLESALEEFIRLFHDSGYVHRDLKPANVVWCGNRFKVIDFGGSCLISEFNGIFGTPGYVSPDAMFLEYYKRNGYASSPVWDEFSIPFIKYTDMERKYNTPGDLKHLRHRVAIYNDIYAIEQIYEVVRKFTLALNQQFKQQLNKPVKQQLNQQVNQPVYQNARPPNPPPKPFR
jgi:serine/threonine protein kinase